MGQVYWKKGNKNGIFNLFFRPNIKRSYFVLSGIDDAINKIVKFKFNNDDILYLKSLSVYDDDFLNYLSDFKFTGSIRAMKEGTIFFPNEPVIILWTPRKAPISAAHSAREEDLACSKELLAIW